MIRVSFGTGLTLFIFAHFFPINIGILVPEIHISHPNSVLKQSKNVIYICINNIF